MTLFIRNREELEHILITDYAEGMTPWAGQTLFHQSQYGSPYFAKKW